MTTQPSPSHLRAIMRMEPKQAIAYLERKGFAITWDWHEMDAAAHARAFTVAKATSLDVLRDLRDGMTGRSLREFQRDLEPTLRAHGWWGKKEIVDANTGEVKTVQLGSPGRLATIYQTNMQSAYMGGRYADAIEAIDTHPYAMYIAVMDASTRPSHAALHGRVFRLDDPVWQHICPPNGFKCRCRFVTMTEKQVNAQGLIVESSQGKMGTVQVATHRDPETGQTRLSDVTSVRLAARNGERGGAFRPDAGFDGGPMASHLMDDLLYRKAQRSLPTEKAALEAVQQTLLAPIRQKAWQAFVARSFAPGAQAAGQTMSVGVMGVKEMAFARAKGMKMASGVIHVDDRLMAGVKAKRHVLHENALSAAEWAALPARLAQPEMVLWDTRRKNFLYIMPSADGRAAKLVLRSNRAQVGAIKVDDAASVFKVSRGAIQAGLKGGQYERVR